MSEVEAPERVVEDDLPPHVQREASPPSHAFHNAVGIAPSRSGSTPPSQVVDVSRYLRGWVPPSVALRPFGLGCALGPSPRGARLKRDVVPPVVPVHDLAGIKRSAPEAFRSEKFARAGDLFARPGKASREKDRPTRIADESCPVGRLEPHSQTRAIVGGPGRAVEMKSDTGDLRAADAFSSAPGRGSRGLAVAVAVPTIGRTEPRSSPGREPRATRGGFADVGPAHVDPPIFEYALGYFRHESGG